MRYGRLGTCAKGVVRVGGGEEENVDKRDGNGTEDEVSAAIAARHVGLLYDEER